MPLCSLDILLEVKEVMGGHLEGFLYGKETFFSVATIERMVKHFKVRTALISMTYPQNAHATRREGVGPGFYGGERTTSAINPKGIMVSVWKK